MAGIESRGFIFGAVLAHRLGLVCAHPQSRKITRRKILQEYALEYGTDKIEIHKDAFTAGARVLLVDDLIATGGTALAACQLVEKAGGKIIEVCFYY